MTRIETLCFVHQPPKILLGMKKVRFGAGKYCGFGGGVEERETPEQAITREMKEEAGIEVSDLIKMGEIIFKFRTGEQNHHVHIFKTDKYKGNVEESEEMKPEWFSIGNIPYSKMWGDSRYWLPLVVQGIKFKATFQYDKNNSIEDYELNEVGNIE